jgi:hypothetical protein
MRHPAVKGKPMSKFDIASMAVSETGELHLKDAEGNLLFCDEKKPITVTLYGPGSREHAQAVAKRNTRQMERLRKKGKIQLSADDGLEEGVEFLADLTLRFSENFAYSPAATLTGRDFVKAVYAARPIGFIADQVHEHIGDWANFTKGSATS